MSNQPPLNPDAEMVHAIMWKDLPFGGKGAHVQLDANAAHKVIELLKPHLAVAQPEVNSVEELDQLPIGSAVLSEKYIAQQEAEEYPCVFQKLYTGDWHRGGRSSDTHPDYFLPARVLYRPEVNS